MCWAFLDTWLLEKGDDADELMQRQGARKYYVDAGPVRAHRHLKKQTRYLVEKAAKQPDVEIVKKVKTKSIEPFYEYIPAVEVKEAKKSRPSHQELQAQAKSQSGDKEWVYIPATSEKKSSKHCSSKVSSKKSGVKVSFILAPSYLVLSFTLPSLMHHRRHLQTKNIEAPPLQSLTLNPRLLQNNISTRTSTTPSHSLTLTHIIHIISTMEEMGSAVVSGAGSDASDYDHWPDDSTQLSAPSTKISGYNAYNGLREYQYHPANEEKKQVVPPPQAAQPAPFTYQVPQNFPQAPAAGGLFAGAPGPIQYTLPQNYYTGAGGGYGYSAYAPHMAYPTPGYYGYPGAGMPYCPPGYTPVYYPGPAAAEKPKEEEKKKKAKKPEVKKWQGRTKAEVEEDNMKIAKAEGAWDDRKVEPVGLAADQMVWVVEVDGDPTLRAYATVKEFEGEWKKDPRFVNSWFFVRAKPEEKK